MVVHVRKSQTYLDTGDRVVVRDHVETANRVGSPRLVITVNDEHLVLSPHQTKLVYEGLRRALLERDQLDEHGLVIVTP